MMRCDGESSKWVELRDEIYQNRDMARWSGAVCYFTKASQQVGSLKWYLMRRSLQVPFFPMLTSHLYQSKDTPRPTHAFIAISRVSGGEHTYEPYGTCMPH